MKKANLLMIGATLVSIVSVAAPPAVKESRPEEGTGRGPRIELPGKAAERPKTRAEKAEENKDIVVPVLGGAKKSTAPALEGKSGQETKPVSGFNGSTSPITIGGSHNGAPLRLIQPGGRPQATQESTAKFTSEFTKEVKDGAKAGEQAAKDVATEASEVVKVTPATTDSVNGKSEAKIEVNKNASKSAYGGEFEKTIEDILSETDESMRKDVEWMLRLFVRTHYKKHKGDANIDAAKAELANSLKEFASIAKQAKELLKDSPELAKKLMRGMVAHYLRNPEKAGEFAKSVESWLKDPKLTSEQKAQTLKGLAITLDTHASEFSKLVAEGKSFEEALKGADSKLSEMLQSKLSAEDFEELAKNCLPGWTLRAAAGVAGRLLSSH